MAWLNQSLLQSGVAVYENGKLPTLLRPADVDEPGLEPAAERSVECWHQSIEK